jgi:hypothetical protein
MILTRYFLLLALLSVSLLAAGPLDDKGPPYFVDRYGTARSTDTISNHAFISSGRGAVTIKGPFSVRTFQKDKLRVEAVFFSPSLKPAAVNLRMGQAWSEEQIQAALAAYGGEWQPLKLASGEVREWVAPDGSNAIRLSSSLHIQSKEVVVAVAKELATDDAKRKAVPTF